MIRAAASHGLALLLGAALVAGYCAFKAPRPAPGAIAVLAPPSAVTPPGTKTVLRECSAVRAYLPKIKERLKLPEVVKQSASIDVIATADVPRDDRPYVAAALLDRATGAGQIAFTPMPQPWLEFPRRFELGLSYLPLNDRGRPETALDGRAELLRVKAIRAGLVGAVADRGGEFGWQLGARVWVGW